MLYKLSSPEKRKSRMSCGRTKGVKELTLLEAVLLQVFKIEAQFLSVYLYSCLSSCRKSFRKLNSWILRSLWLFQFSEVKSRCKCSFGPWLIHLEITICTWTVWTIAGFQYVSRNGVCMEGLPLSVGVLNWSVSEIVSVLHWHADIGKCWPCWIGLRRNEVQSNLYFLILTAWDLSVLSTPYFEWVTSVLQALQFAVCSIF